MPAYQRRRKPRPLAASGGPAAARISAENKRLALKSAGGLAAALSCSLKLSASAEMASGGCLLRNPVRLLRHRNAINGESVSIHGGGLISGGWRREMAIG